MPENSCVATPPKSILGPSTFAHRREDIFKRLKYKVDQCKNNYSERKELANEKDEIVSELCDCLDEAFNYGLRQNDSFVVTAANLFHEIVGSSNMTSISNETTFWDFCQHHLTPHERERFENLKNVWTKNGRGRAFLRAALNENSLQRYLLTWLNDKNLLRYYTPWSLLLDEETSKLMPELLGNLNNVLFALTVDSLDHNKALSSVQMVRIKEEPIIYAPTPIPLANVNSKRKINPVERPIATKNTKEDFLNNLTLTTNTTTNEETNTSSNLYAESNGTTEDPAQLMQLNDIPFDPIEPELEFLKQPLPDVHPENQTILHVANNAEISKVEEDFEDKSDSSSQYSKASSTQYSANCAALEEKLRELTERYALLETRVAHLSLENRQLVRRLTRHFNESGIDPTSSFATNFLITIPTVQLIQPKRATSSSYYAYEVHITMRQNLEHWSVLRRYRDFYKLHKTLLRTHPSIANVEIPPKKHFGNKNLIFVEERRQQLQIYLLNLVESLPQVEACKTKANLQRAFPFLRER